MINTWDLEFDFGLHGGILRGLIQTEDAVRDGGMLFNLTQRRPRHGKAESERGQPLDSIKLVNGKPLS
jgi:hypothetical protein